MIAPCRMDGKHCLDCGRVHFGKALEYSQGTDERSVAIRRLWRDGGTTPHPPKPILRSIPLAKQCSNNTGENGRAKAGCTTCATYGCNVHGTVRLSQCVYCEDYQKPPLTMLGEMEMWQNAYQEKTTPRAEPSWHVPIPYNDQSRHLLFHIWPRKTHAGTWQRNLDQLKLRWPLFTGKRIIAVATSGDSHPFEAVQEYMHGYECEWIQVENKPELREVATFAHLFSSVESLPGYTFYGQAKGVTKPVNPGVSIHAWTTTMYEILLDYWPLVEEALKTHCTAGIFKKSVDGAFDGSRSTWHYSGSFCWFKNAELWRRNWRAIEQVWFGIESYPSMIFSREEAACLFYESTKQFDLYRLHNWQRVEAELKQWRKDHQQYRTGIIK